MSEPRNVTPGKEPQQDQFHRRFYSERSEGPEWVGWSWASRVADFPWLGVLLVLVGIGLLVQYVCPNIGTGTLVLLAIVAGLSRGWLFGRFVVARWCPGC